MKIPLRYQVTEFDCGPTALLNAFSFLFARKELPIELVKVIYLNTLDCHDKKFKGTSKKAIKKIISWINSHNPNVTCKNLEKEEVTLDKMINCLNNNGCIFIRCWQSCEHYVIITKVDKKYGYIFDSYYLNKKKYDKDQEIKIILSKPFNYNRKVSLKRLFSETKKDFSMGYITERECVLINRI